MSTPHDDIEFVESKTEETAPGRMNRRKVVGMGTGLVVGALVTRAAFAQGGTPTPPSATPSASPAASPMASGAGIAPIQIHTIDIAFDPKAFTIPAKTNVQVIVTNKGVLQHDFTIDALKIATKLLNGGESETVTINAAAGEYQYYCSVPGHKEAGMVGKLTVK